MKEVTVAFEVGGRIISLPVREGEPATLEFQLKPTGPVFTDR